MVGIKVCRRKSDNLRRFDETAGVSGAWAEPSVAASGEATGAELLSIWTKRAHVHARRNGEIWRLAVTLWSERPSLCL